MSIALISRFKNERHIMYEWINHHFQEGIDKIYLIDDNSDDDYLKLNPWLKVLMNQKKIKIFKSRNSDQNKDYNNFLKIIKKHKWVIQLDIDEFIFCPRNKINLKTLLNKKYSNIDYITIRWKIFTHKDKLQPKSIIFNNTFTHRSKTDPSSLAGIKCIGKTKHLNSIGIHGFTFNKKINVLFLENCHNNNIQINHYRTQSDEYLYGVKEQRGGGVHKNKYQLFTSHIIYDYSKECLILKNKRLNLIENCNNKKHIRPKIYIESSWYKNLQEIAGNLSDDTFQNLVLQSESINDFPLQSESIDDFPLQSESIDDFPLQSESIDDFPLQSESIDDFPLHS